MIPSNSVLLIKTDSEKRGNNWKMKRLSIPSNCGVNTQIVTPIIGTTVGFASGGGRDECD
jgi:hypothetical protein